MNKVYDVLYKRGEDSQGHGIWLKCGVILKKKDGKMSLKLDAIPVGNDFDGWLVISARKDKKASSGATGGSNA